MGGNGPVQALFHEDFHGVVFGDVGGGGGGYGCWSVLVEGGLLVCGGVGGRGEGGGMDG